MKFCPDIGIASGTVMAGFTGTPKEYSASVFGRPLILAAGCARLKLRGRFDSIITFPAAEWRGRSFEALFSPLATEGSEKGRDRQEPRWRLGEPREVDFPGSGRVALQDIAHIIPSMPSLSAETKVREWMELIRAKGYYKKKD